MTRQQPAATGSGRARIRRLSWTNRGMLWQGQQAPAGVRRAETARSAVRSRPSLPTRSAQVSRLTAGTPLLDEPTDSGIIQAEGFPTIDTDIWLPFAALVLGWGLAQITEVLKDRRSSNRERLARRAELQRTTLLELQDALLELWWGALGVHWLVPSGLDQPEEKPALKHLTQASRNLAATRGRVKLLASRVEDERVRDLATASVELSSRVDGRSAQGAAALGELDGEYSAAVARIGELLREY